MISLPQPSPAGPQPMFCCAQVSGVQVGTGGVRHCPRSQIMYSSAFSCALSAVVSHSLGKVPALVTSATWKSL